MAEHTTPAAHTMRAANTPAPSDDARNRRPGGMFVLLAGLPTLAVIVSTVGLVLAAGGAGDLVRDDYYKAGLVVQRDVAAEQQADALGLQMDLTVNGDNVEVQSAQSLPNELQLAFVHPAWAAKDVSVTLARVPATNSAGSARWRGRVATPLPNARWTVIVTADGARWRLRGEAQLPGSIELGGQSVSAATSGTSLTTPAITAAPPITPPVASAAARNVRA